MPARRTSALPHFRISEPGGAYFVTCCTQQRKPGLTTGFIPAAIKEAISSSDEAGDTVTWAFALMPDHGHWLFNLGSRLSLGRMVARLKAQTNRRLTATSLGWQRDFFEHTLKPDEPAEAYALQVFLNPCRAGLIKAGEIWPHWWRPQPDRFAFAALLEAGGQGPPPRISDSPGESAGGAPERTARWHPNTP